MQIIDTRRLVAHVSACGLGGLFPVNFHNLLRQNDNHADYNDLPFETQLATRNVTPDTSDPSALWHI